MRVGVEGVLDSRCGRSGVSDGLGEAFGLYLFVRELPEVKVGSIGLLL